jgi:hypothetical protein
MQEIIANVAIALVCIFGAPVALWLGACWLDSLTGQ